MDEKIIFLNEVDSTNEYAKLNMDKLQDGAIVVAEVQTQGKGRFDRKWISEEKGNLYCSIIQKDISWLTFPTQLPIFIAVVVKRLIATIIQEDLETVGLKWPNDIFAEKGKLAGILIESFSGSYVIGIGLNVVSSPTLKSKKTSSIDSISDLEYFPLPEGIAEVLLAIYESAITEYKENGFEPFKQEWLDCCIHLNSKIELNDNVVDDNAVKKEIIFLGINNDGSARIKDLSNDLESSIYYGELNI